MTGLAIALDALARTWTARITHGINTPDPEIDWPARFRAAAAAAALAPGRGAVEQRMRGIAGWLEAAAPPQVVEAIGRALLGEPAETDTEEV